MVKVDMSQADIKKLNVIVKMLEEIGVTVDTIRVYEDSKLGMRKYEITPANSIFSNVNITFYS